MILLTPLCLVKCASFDSMVAMVARVGWDGLLEKCDIKSSFHLLPVHPLDFNLLALTLKGIIMIKHCQ